MVELHNGRIWFDSTPNIQTTFYIELPKESDSHINIASVEESIRVQADEISEPVDDSTLSTLLIIDDNVEMLHLLRDLFMSSYKILLAHDGVEGWDLASNLLPDIIISDVMMPRMNGIEFCDKLKSDTSTSHIPIILLSAKSSDTDIAMGFRVAADGYCPKPFNNIVLKEIVNSTLINRRKLAANRSIVDVNKEGGAFQFVNFCDSATTNSDKVFLKRLTDYIEMNLQNSELTAVDVCSYMGVSSFILNKKLKALLNMTAIVLIRTIRLRRAAYLLKTSEYNVTEVTYEVGFNDLKYFRRCFKDEFGVLPNEYK